MGSSQTKPPLQEPLAADEWRTFTRWALQTPYACLLDKLTTPDLANNPCAEDPFPWDNLPEDIRGAVVSHLPLTQLARASRVSRSFRSTVRFIFHSLCAKFCPRYTEQLETNPDEDWVSTFSVLLKAVTFFNINVKHNARPDLWHEFKHNASGLRYIPLQHQRDQTTDLQLLCSFDAYTISPAAFELAITAIFPGTASSSTPHPKDVIRQYVQLALEPVSKKRMSIPSRFRYLSDRVPLFNATLEVFKEMVLLYPLCQNDSDADLDFCDPEWEQLVRNCLNNPLSWDAAWKKHKDSADGYKIFSLCLISPSDQRLHLENDIKAVVACEGFARPSVVQTLRLFTTCLRFPGEAQMIDRVVEKTSTRITASYRRPGNHMKLDFAGSSSLYQIYETLPDFRVVDDLLSCSDDIFLLMYSLIMLNTEHVRYPEKYPLSSFLANLRSCRTSGQDFPQDFLEELYYELKGAPMRFQ